LVVAGITVVPVGTGTSLSRYVAECIREIEKSGLKYKVTPTATVVEGSVDEVLSLIKKVHEVPFKLGAKRTFTVIKIDDRRDKPLSMNGKIESIKARLPRVEV